MTVRACPVRSACRLPGVELRIASKDGAVLPQGEIGLIEVRGPNVFKGYWRMPDKTAAEFRADGFFITGDLGRIDENGYVHILGRDKDLIISGGFNVYPKEIESLIDELPGVTKSAVVGLPHRDFGEGVTACIVAGKGAHLDGKRRAGCPCRQAGEIQTSQAGDLRRRTAAQRHGQSAEKPDPREVQQALRLKLLTGRRACHRASTRTLWITGGLRP